MLEGILRPVVFLSSTSEPLAIPSSRQEMGRPHLPIEPGERNILIKRAVPGGASRDEVSQRILLKAGDHGIARKREARWQIQEDSVLYGAALSIVADEEEQLVSAEWTT